MTLPARTPEQRAQALDAALAARRARARLREQLKTKVRSGVDLIWESESDTTWASLRVSWVLESLPGIGPARAQALMLDCAIASTRRLGGLSPRQRAGLVRALGGATA